MGHGDARKGRIRLKGGSFMKREADKLQGGKKAVLEGRLNGETGEKTPRGVQQWENRKKT